jgi:RNA polymerase sigma-70 factor (ECF subfamily)
MARPARPSAPWPAPHGRAALERQWLEQVRTGDAKAFEELFRAYAEALCAYVFTYVDSRETAQELVQDLFTRVWQSRHTLDMPRSVRAYLYTAARNRAINYLRDRRVERAFMERARRDELPHGYSPSSSEIEEGIDAATLSEALSAAVRELPLRCREVFTLTREQHLSYAEVAEVLGITRKTVEIHMGRALAILREKLRPWVRR